MSFTVCAAWWAELVQACASAIGRKPQNVEKYCRPGALELQLRCLGLEAAERVLQLFSAASDTTICASDLSTALATVRRSMAQDKA
eukprot:COSAG02_NODE_17318_length_1012_cov_2.105148_1_plen_86_part_00